MFDCRFLFFALGMVMIAVGAQAASPIKIGSRLELFVDDYLIDNLENTQLRLHHPVERETMLTMDAPWEGETSAYVTIFKDGTRYRMYYRGSNYNIEPHELTCTAESVDGIRWIKPDIGMYEFNGSKKNSIVHIGRGTHNFTPFRDTNPNVKQSEQYKAVGSDVRNDLPILRAFVSPDGYTWTDIQEDPIITEGAFDSQNLAFWDSQKGVYVCYFRDFRDGVRDIKVATSKDFRHWEKPQWLNISGAKKVNLYTNAIQPYFRAPYIYVGFPKRFFEDRKLFPDYKETGISDGGFMSSRDGVNFNIWGEAFMRPGPDDGNWTDRSTMAAWGMFELKPGEISMYYSRDYQHPTCRIARATIRTDGFASLHAGSVIGSVTTKPLIFEGSSMSINFATSAGGGIRVELQDAAGKPVKNFEMENCPVIYGDKINHTVKWKSGTNVSTLSGQTVRIKFELIDADIYSMQFRL